MKVSLVAEGGKMRGAYAAGAMFALDSYFGLRRVDFAAASSASTGSLAYYVSGQVHHGREIWVDYVSSPRFLSPKRILKLTGWFEGPPLLDVDFLIDDVFRQFLPLDIKALENSRTLMITPVTNVETGKAKYFTNRDKVDLFEVLRASKASPILYDRSVEINGEFYCDGGMNDPVPVNLPWIRGSKKIIIITTLRSERKGYGLFAWAFKSRLSKGVHETLRSYAGRRGELMDQIDKLEEGGDILIHPTRDFPSLDNRPRTIERIFDQGFEDAVSNEKLADFIDLLRGSKNGEFYFN